MGMEPVAATGMPANEKLMPRQLGATLVDQLKVTVAPGATLVDEARRLAVVSPRQSAAWSVRSSPPVSAGTACVGRARVPIEARTTRAMARLRRIEAPR